MSDPTLREFIIAIMDERERANQRALEMAATRLNERLEAENIRAQKLWQLSDRIRDGLAKLGIVLEDKKDGTSSKRTS